MPPSTTNSAPLVKADASLARKTIVPATSAGSPGRPTGISRCSGSMRVVICVRMNPGCTELTRMPEGPSSTASDCDSPRTPNFAAV